MKTRAELEAAIERGEPLKYLFFWGHTPRADGQLSPSCLSQWWPATFREGDDTFASAEHYMMAGKARLFGDEGSRARILAADHPGEAKRLGRGVAGFDGARWDAARFELVVQANYLKFKQNSPLLAFLLATGARVLVEASPVDRIWGIGL
ncbi:MAG: NADAR family protein, partial [Myxococcales bacterium]|nr:NADAR family protein [Myxococcales bacterium]